MALFFAHIEKFNCGLINADCTNFCVFCTVDLVTDYFDIDKSLQHTAYLLLFSSIVSKNRGDLHKRFIQMNGTEDEILTHTHLSVTGEPFQTLTSQAASVQQTLRIHVTVNRGALLLVWQRRRPKRPRSIKKGILEGKKLQIICL